MYIKFSAEGVEYLITPTENGLNLESVNDIIKWDIDHELMKKYIERRSVITGNFNNQTLNL